MEELERGLVRLNDSSNELSWIWKREGGDLDRRKYGGGLSYGR